MRGLGIGLGLLSTTYLAAMVGSGGGGLAPVLFIAAGQSNANSHGTNGVTPPAEAEGMSNVFVLNGSAFEPYDPGTNAGDEMTGAWGAELMFAVNFVAAYPGRPLYIVKRAVGGTGLTPDGVADWAPTSSGELFSELETRVNLARTLINNPSLIEVSDWAQGEREIQNALHATYEGHFTTFLTAYRTRISDGLFIMERTRPIPDKWTESWTVRDAQCDVTEADGNAVVVDQDNLAGSDIGNLWAELHPGSAHVLARGTQAFNVWNTGAGNVLTDAVPNSFNFANLSGQASGGQVASAAITLTGIEREAVITVTGGEYQLLNPDNSVAVAWTSSAGLYHKHMKVQVRTPTTAADTSYNVVLTVGGVSDTWTCTTAAAGGFAPVGNTSSQLLATGSTTVTFPSGTTTGDYVTIEISLNTPDAIPTTPAGWTSICTAATGGSANGSLRAIIYGRLLQSGDTPPSITVAGNTTAVVAAYRGLNATTPLASATAAATLLDTSVSFPAPTATAGQKVVYIAFTAEDTGVDLTFTTATNSGTLTPLYEVDNATQLGIESTVSAAYGTVVANGAVGGAAGTINGTWRKVLATLLFNPA